MQIAGRLHLRDNFLRLINNLGVKLFLSAVKIQLSSLKFIKNETLSSFVILLMHRNLRHYRKIDSTRSKEFLLLLFPQIVHSSVNNFNTLLFSVAWNWTTSWKKRILRIPEKFKTIVNFFFALQIKYTRGAIYRAAIRRNNNELEVKDEW